LQGDPEAAGGRFQIRSVVRGGRCLVGALSLSRKPGISMPQLSVREMWQRQSLAKHNAGLPVSDGRVDSVRRMRQHGGYNLAPRMRPSCFVGAGCVRALPHFMTPLTCRPFGQTAHRFTQGLPDAWEQTRWAGRPHPRYESDRAILESRPQLLAKIRRLLRDFSACFPDLVDKLKSHGRYDRTPARIYVPCS